MAPGKERPLTYQEELLEQAVNPAAGAGKRPVVANDGANNTGLNMNTGPIIGSSVVPAAPPLFSDPSDLAGQGVPLTGSKVAVQIKFNTIYSHVVVCNVSGYTPPAPTDIGKTVTANGTPKGILVAVDPATRTWVISYIGAEIAPADALVVATGSGIGVAASYSTLSGSIKGFVDIYYSYDDATYFYLASVPIDDLAGDDGFGNPNPTGFNVAGDVSIQNIVLPSNLVGKYIGVVFRNTDVDMTNIYTVDTADIIQG